MNKGIDIFTNEDYNNINLDYPEGYLEKLLKVTEQENQQLKEKLDKYENPDDMTLYTMWCTEKVKDENKQLKDNWNKLKEYLECNWQQSQDIWFVKIINKMQELESSDTNE